MKPEVKVKWIYALLLSFGCFMLLQMGLFFLHQIWNVPIHWNIIRYCAAVLGNDYSSTYVGITLFFNLIILYTGVRIVWRIGKQWVLTRRWLSVFRKAQHNKLTKRLNRKYRYWRTEFIVIQDEAFLALVLGVWKPKIVVSAAVFNLCNEREVEAILLHERYHCRNRDNLKLFLSVLMVDAFGYLPIVKSIVRYYQISKELLADRYAIKQMGNETDLGNVLLKITKLAKTVPYRTAGVHFATNALEYRMMQVLEPHKTVQLPLLLSRPLLISLMIVIVMSSLLFGGC